MNDYKENQNQNEKVMNQSNLNEEEKTIKTETSVIQDNPPSSIETNNMSNAKTESSFTRTEHGNIKNNTVNKKIKKKKSISTTSLISIVIIVCLLSSSFGAFMGINIYEKYNKNTFKNNEDQNMNTTVIKTDTSMFYAAAINEKNKDAVVGISTSGTQKVDTFFGTAEQDYEAIGSGFIVSHDGYIVTNSHVIGDGNYTSVKVSLSNGDIEEAKVLWFEPFLDLAIIKIERSNLNYVELGDSDSLIEGEPVAAIGNPLSLKFNGSITDGIISGLNRSIEINGKTIKPLIQTNASINPGNSGGPLFNSEGKVIGINTAKMKSAEGLGFSIPINTLKPILAQLTNTGEIQNVYIGIKGTSVNRYESVLGIDLNAEEGVYIVEVQNNTPAKTAKLKSGDIIIKIDDNKITDMQDIKAALYKYQVGDSAKLVIIRDGEEKEVMIKFEKASN